MSWIKGSASDHKDFSDALVAAATGDSLSSVDSIVAPGTAYVVGDILTVVGGTGTIAAQVEVTTVSSGTVTAVRRSNDGVYTAPPTGTLTTTGGTGTGCTLTCTFAANGWTALRNATDGLSSVDSVVAGGTGYAIGNVITLAGGTTTNPARIEVTAVTGGVITAVSIDHGGSYSATPSDPVAQESVQPTGGSGATFNVTWAGGTREVVLEGEGDGTDEILVGWRTLESVPSDYYTLELHGFTGADSDLPFTEQPGISPGIGDSSTTTERSGAYLISYSSSHDYFLNVTPYRIIIVTKLTGRYFNAYLGWGNPFATASENPYPLVVCGCTSLFSEAYNTSLKISGLIDPWRSTDVSGDDAGPMFVWMPDGAWYSVANGSVGIGSRTQLNDRVVVPCGEPGGVATADAADRFCTAAQEFGFFIPQSGVASTATANMWPTGDDEDRVLLPNMVVFELPAPQIVLELDSIYWVSGFGGVASEERVIINDEVYRIFQNGNRTEPWAFFAIKEV